MSDLERLRDALRRYGDHLADCRVKTTQSACGCGCGRCDCGWDSVKEEVDRMEEPLRVPRTEYVAWNDPRSRKIRVLTRTAAMLSQHIAASLMGWEPYADNDAALLAFMAERGAWTCDRPDGKMDDE